MVALNALSFHELKRPGNIDKTGHCPQGRSLRKWTRAFLRGRRRQNSFARLPVDSMLRLAHGGRRIGLLESGKLREQIVHRLAYSCAPCELLGRRLDWRRSGVQIVDHAPVDIVVADFDDEGRLIGIILNLKVRRQRHGTPAMEIVRSWIPITRQTTWMTRGGHFSLPKCCARLRRGRQDRQQELAYIERALSSVFFHFEVAQPKDRFQPPDFSRRKHPGHGVFNVLCRSLFGPGRSGLVVSGKPHIADASPVLELLDKLRTAWGTTGPVTVPAPSGLLDSHPVVGHKPSRKVVGAYRFLCFERLLLARKELNQKYGHLVGGITLASLIVWGLARHPAFQDVKVATAVDLLPRQGRKEERTLSFVNSRPARFLDRQDRERSFLRFQRISTSKWRLLGGARAPSSGP